MDIHLRASKLISRARMRPVLTRLRGRVLDVGCGRGYILDHLPPGLVYVGIDINPDYIKTHRASHPRHRFYDMDASLNMPEREPPFDTVICLAVIEHIDHPEKLLQGCRRMLREQGHLILTTPTPRGDRVHGVLEKVWLAHPGVQQHHLHVFSPEQLADLVVSCGYRVLEHRTFQWGINQVLVATGA